MKVGVIGNGKVGLAVYRELQDVREVSEVVLIGRNPEKIRGGSGGLPRCGATLKLSVAPFFRRRI